MLWFQEFSHPTYVTVLQTTLASPSSKEIRIDNSTLKHQTSSLWFFSLETDLSIFGKEKKKDLAEFGSSRTLELFETIMHMPAHNMRPEVLTKITEHVEHGHVEH